MMKVVVLIIVLLQAFVVRSQAGGGDCSNLEPICTDVGISFTATSGVADASITNPGNNYDCLITQPNPTWYYLEIANSGDIIMNLSAGSDIDFIIYGPFASLADAEANCNSYSNVVDCSFSATNNETPQILGAVVGEVYVMLVTNYANVVQNITLTQSGGSGNTDCTIVNPPTSNCPDYATQASSPTEACGNQFYYLEVLNTGCNGFITFNVVGNYGSDWASEITWEVVSNQTGTAVASGGPGINGGSINVVVGPLDPAVYGTIFNLLVYDSFGDGFNGTGGIIQVTSTSGAVLADIDGNFGSQSNQYFTSGIQISSATIDVTTPSGVVSTSIGNCQDFNVQLTLDNNNFCTPLSLNLPWQITCDATGAIISSGTHSITVNPQVPTQASDVVSISWDAASCSWNVSANNDCDLLDIGTLFTISPDPATAPAYCSNGTENFTVDYLGFAAGPNCCLTAGPLVPITYNSTINESNFVTSDAYAGTNNSAYGVVNANGVGGDATSVTVNVSGSGYCCPDCSSSPEPYYVDVYIDGVQVLFEGPLTNTSFSYSFNEVDLSALGVTYTDNSIIEVYVLPNNFWYTAGVWPFDYTVYTTYVGGVSCGSLGEGEWTMGTLTTSVSAVFQEQTATAVSCSYPLSENYTCCSSGISLPPNDGSAISCASDIFVPTPPTVNDNCGNAIIPVMTENSTPACIGDKIYTFTYTDCAGNTANWTYTFSINDNIPPTASNPVDINIAVAPAPAPDITLVIDEADNCTANPVVAFVSDVSDGNSCPETITRTYSVTDDCGNQTLVTQLIIIGGGPVPDPVVTANGPICTGNDAVFTITGVVDAVVTYDLGQGPNTVTLTGGSATVTVSGVTTNTTITLTNIVDGSCTTSLNLTATTVVNTQLMPTFDLLGPFCQTGPVDPLLTSSLEGYTGSWSPGVVDNSSSGTFTYTFTADPGQCVANTTMDITITDAPFVSAAALDSTLCEGDSTVLFIDSLSGGLLVEQFTMTFGAAFSYTTSNTNLPGSYYVVVSGTWSGSGACELRDPAYIMYQGCNNITPIPSYIWKWNGQGPPTQATCPYVYNPNHSYNFFFNGGLPQTFSFAELNPNWYGDNSGSLTFEIYYLGNISWSTGSTEASDTVFPPVGSNTYTVTLDYGNGCSATDDVVIQVDPMITPTFTQLGPYCENGLADAFNNVSNEGITGVWGPPGINTGILGTTSYTFVSDIGQCSTNTTMDITVDPAIQSTFTQLGPYCLDDVPDVLLTTSLEGVTGTWSPVTINTAIGGINTYTFAIDAGQCALGTTMDVEVNSPTIPTFTQIPPLCINVAPPNLPSTSNNGIDGTWNPAVINTSVAGISTYTFTPNPSGGGGQTILNSNYDFENGSGGSCSCPTGFTCNNDAGQVFDGVHPLWVVGNNGCIGGTTNYTSPLGAYSGTGYVYFYAGLDNISTAPIPFVGGEVIDICVWYSGPQGAGASGQNTANAHFSFGIDGNQVGPDVWVPTNTGWTQHCFTVTMTAGNHTFQVLSGGAAQYSIWFDDFTVSQALGGCSTTATMDIDIVSPPFVDAGIDQTITCTSNVGGAQIGSAAIPGNTYSWTPSTGLSASNIAEPIANPSGTTTYTVTVTNAAGCVSVDQVNVTVDTSPPIVGITNNTGSTVLTCTLLDISLTATGGVSYSWDSGLGTSSNVTINSPGIYTVTGIAPNGCEATSQIEITQDNNVDLILSLSDDEICSGEDITITANSTNATSFDWTVVENGVTGATGGSGANSPQGMDITQTLTATGAATGTVNYTITPILGTCQGTPQIIIVTVNPPVLPTFTQLGPFCENEIPTIGLSAISDNDISGNWSPSTISTAASGVSTYSFTPSAGECATSTTMDIIVNALPNVTFSADILEGCAPLNVTLTCGSASGNCIWTISNGDVINGCTAITTFNSSGCYDVSLLLEENGCSNSLTIPDYICVQNDPHAAFSFSPGEFSDVNQQVTFTNNSLGAVEYIWNFGDGSSNTITNPTHLYEETEDGALVTLIAISDFGCTDTVEHFISYDEQEIFYVPNTFTPDGDNFNQVFTPVFYSGFDPYNFEMLIFNRWGELIFESHNSEVGWDGSYGSEGRTVQDGMYTWKITYENPETDERKILIGHVSLIR